MQLFMICYMCKYSCQLVVKLNCPADGWTKRIVGPWTTTYPSMTPAISCHYATPPCISILWLVAVLHSSPRDLLGLCVSRVGLLYSGIFPANRKMTIITAFRLSNLHSGSGFTVKLGSDSLGKSNDLGVSNVSRIHFGFGFIVNPDPDPIIE